MRCPKDCIKKMRKTRTFEMDVMQKILSESFQPLHIYACTNITKLVLHGLLQIKQYCFIQGVNMQKYDHISCIDIQIR